MFSHIKMYEKEKVNRVDTHRSQKMKQKCP